MYKKRANSGSNYFKSFLALCATAFICILFSNRAAFGHTSPPNTAMTSSFTFSRERISRNSEKYALHREGSSVSFREFLDLLSSDSHFRLLFTRVLQAVEFPGYLFECPSVSNNAVDGVPFEFVVTNSPSLARAEADPEPFRKHFSGCSDDVTSFVNLGGDARLVVPCHVSTVSKDAYTHLAQFVRYAPFSQVEHFWQVVSDRVRSRLFEIHDSDMWLSTNGNGVSWLHVRLDSYPKYYAHTPYKHPTREGF